MNKFNFHIICSYLEQRTSFVLDWQYRMKIPTFLSNDAYNVKNWRNFCYYPLFDKRSYPDADAAMHSCGGARSPEKGELMI